MKNLALIAAPVLFFFSFCDRAAALVRSKEFGGLPLSFENNQGQTNDRANFLCHGPGYSLFISPNEAIFRLRGSSLKSSGETLGKATELRIKLIDANQRAEAEGLEELAGKVNYLIGNQPEKWQKQIPTFARIRYRSLYPKIDLIYYGDQRQLEYDFVVAPGGDPAAIALQFDGAKNLELDATGNLVIKTSAETIVQGKPSLYQDIGGRRCEVRGGYRIGSDVRVRFTFGPYDKHRPLVIDPVLTYSTFFGGSKMDSGAAIAVDAAGNVYIAGQTDSLDFPTHNPLPGPTAAVTNAFIMKLNAAGTAVIYSTHLGGNGVDQINDLAIDSSGNACVIGNTTAPDFPRVNPIQATHGDGTTYKYDAFIAKLNTAGNGLIFSTYLGGKGDDFGLGIALSSTGEIVVSGHTEATNFPVVNALQRTSAGWGDAFVARLNAAGSAFVFSTYLGGRDDDWADALALDASGNVLLSGWTSSDNFPRANAVQGAAGGGNDGFVTKLNPTGTALLYSTYLGGDDSDFANGVAVDSAGNAYVVGTTLSTNFPVVNALRSTRTGSSTDAFITKLNSLGSLVYSTYFGGDSADQGQAVAVDQTGSVYITGATASDNFPCVGEIQSSRSGSYDAFVSKIDPSGTTLLYSTYFGGNMLDIGNDIAVDTTGNAYLTGHTGATNFPTLNATQSTYGGGIEDAFVVKLSQAGPCRIVSLDRLPSGRTVLRGIGVPSAAYAVQATDALIHRFENIGTAIADSTGAFQLEDSSVPSAGERFYRIVP